jgi:adenylate cyclase
VHKLGFTLFGGAARKSSLRKSMKALPKFFREHVVLAAIVFGIAFGLARYGWLDRLENNAIDALTRLRAERTKRPPNPQLALIGIGEVSLKGFGRWPWSREVHGDFLRLASVAGARVVTWDIIFAESTARIEEDAYLVEGVKFARETEAKTAVIFGATFGIKAKKQDQVDVGVTSGSEEAKASTLKPLLKIEGDRMAILSADLMQLPAGELGRSAEIAFVDAPPGRDGIRRLLPLVVRVGSIVYPTLSLKSLMESWDAKPEQVTVRLGDAVLVETDKVHQRIPINIRGEFLINYRHHLDDCNAAEYGKLFEALSLRYAKGEEIETPDFKGKILLVGQVADGLTDIGPSPLDARTPLVLVHANAIGNILEGDFARRVPAAPIWLGAFGLGLMGLVAVSKREKLRDHMLFALGVPIAYYLAAYYSWERWSLWLPLVGPMIGFVGLQIAELVRRVRVEQQAKKEIKGMFGTYVSPELVNKMIDSGTPPQLGGHDAEITAYFSDIQAFSTFSEKLGPGPLVELMNEYLTACSDIVQEQGGAVDKYVGDMLMAMFGAPVPVPDHALRACVASQLVQQKLGELRAKWKADGDTWPPIVWNMQTRIGLNSGVCMIGNMGSRARFNYTMMGDNVNLAARMESGAKSWGAFSMATEATKLGCEKYGGERVVFRQLGRIVVKGRSTAVPVYEIVGLKEHVTTRTRECLGLFEEALAKHYARDWAGAIALFEQSAHLEPNIPRQTAGVSSNPSLIYLDITRHYQMESPPEDWDGVYHMAEK